ncbi:hypothetical protein QTP88_013321 [Uroleucon formosanum]
MTDFLDTQPLFSNLRFFTSGKAQDSSYVPYPYVLLKKQAGLSYVPIHRDMSSVYDLGPGRPIRPFKSPG